MKQNFVIFRKTPLSALRAAQSEFSSPRHVFRAHHYQNAAASPFLQKPQVCGKWSALTERRGFRTRRNCLHSSHNFFRADERKSREAGGNLPCARLCRAGGGFSPLFLPFRGSRFINGKKIHLHPYTYNGKTAKTWFCRFFVFVFKVSKILHFTFYILHFCTAARIV